MQTQIKKASESMERRVSHMQQEFSEIRAGRANPGVLDKVKVDYYGAPTPVWINVRPPVYGDVT